MLWHCRAGLLKRGACCAVVVMALAGRALAQQPDGIDLYLEAIRNRGDNPAVIQSASVELEARILTELPSEEQSKKRTAEMRQATREFMERSEDANLKAHLKQTLGRIDEELVATQLLANASRRLKVHVLFRHAPEGHSQYRLLLQHFDREKDDWTEPMQAIREKDPRAALKGLFYEPRDHTAIVNDGAFNAGIGDVRQFGRIQGPQAMMATAAFADRDHPGTLDFSEANVAKFKAEIRKVAEGNPNVAVFNLVREEPFEGSTVAVVETSRTESGKTIPMQRIWIDPARGYVCPLVETFFEDGRTAQKWESTGYFQEENSGLWYPQHHEYTQFDEHGVQKRKETYDIDAETLALNDDPPSEAFQVHLPPNLSIIRRPERAACFLPEFATGRHLARESVGRH